MKQQQLVGKIWNINVASFRKVWDFQIHEMNLFDTLHWGDMIPPQLYVTSVLTKQSQNSPHKSPLGDC